MVMNTEKEMNKNGKKSVNSPFNNKPTIPAEDNQLTPETSDDDSNSKKNLGKKNGKSEFEEKIRVGKDYQALVPPMNSKADTYIDKALLVWSPANHIPESKLEEYITLAKERYGYNAEQAYGMLFWHKHDLEKAVIDLANFTPFPEEWSKEDKVLFEQAFQFHGKCFHRIRQMLPDKSIASLVKFYYSWKKNRTRTSVMDRQEKRRNEGASENGSDGTPDNSDVEDKKWPIRGIQRTSRSPTRTVSNVSPKPTSKIQDIKRMAGMNNRNENKDTGYSSSSSSSNGISKLSSLNCQNCKVLCNELKQTLIGSFCSSCFQHWRRTGVVRPIEGPNVQRPRSKTNKLYYYQGYHDGSSKYKRKPPKGMYINHDDVLKLAAQDLNETMTPRKQPVPHKFDLLAEVDREINVLYSHIQTNKQKISSLKMKNEQFRDVRMSEEIAMNRVNIRWTKDEMSLALEGFQKFGQNFKAIAEVISTKTESHVRKFFAKYRKSKNLDTVCQTATAQKSNTDEVKQDSIEVMEIDSDDDINVSEKNLETNEQSGLNNINNNKMEGEISITIERKRSQSTEQSVKSVKRKADAVDEGGPVKKVLPSPEITITPISKSKVSDSEKQNGKDVA